MKINRGDLEDAAEEFMKWTKAAGRVLPGLVKRRKDERAMYLYGA
jgi:lysozyme